MLYVCCMLIGKTCANRTYAANPRSGPKHKHVTRAKPRGGVEVLGVSAYLPCTIYELGRWRCHFYTL
jgi:hypothetical protein